jgi:hypothetical protein
MSVFKFLKTSLQSKGDEEISIPKPRGNIQIEDVAEKGTADLRLKAKPAVIKKAS